jgi:hypothetical protein
MDLPSLNHQLLMQDKVGGKWMIDEMSERSSKLIYKDTPHFRNIIKKKSILLAVIRIDSIWPSHGPYMRTRPTGVT